MGGSRSAHIIPATHGCQEQADTTAPWLVHCNPIRPAGLGDGWCTTCTCMYVYFGDLKFDDTEARHPPVAGYRREVGSLNVLLRVHTAVSPLDPKPSAVVSRRSAAHSSRSASKKRRSTFVLVCRFPRIPLFFPTFLERKSFFVRGVLKPQNGSTSPCHTLQTPDNILYCS